MPRNRISGAQPTFATLGKAKGSKTGNKRAKAGHRVGRRDAFPEDGGHHLLDPRSDDDDESNDETAASKKRRAGSRAARRDRVAAAEKRASSYSASLADDIPSDFSHHSSDAEPDSDDPDRENGRLTRWRDTTARRANTRPAGPARGAGGGGNPDLDEIRRKRAEAAEKRRIESMTIVLDGQETDEERDYHARMAQEQSARVADANAKGKGKGVVRDEPARQQDRTTVTTTTTTTGARLGGPSKEEQLAQLERELADMPPAVRAHELEIAAAKLGIARDDARHSPPRRASTSRQTLDLDAPDAPAARRRRRRRAQRLFIASSASEGDDDDDAGLVDPALLGTSESRAARRRRTLGTDSNGPRSNAVRSIDTGASGTGSANAFVVGGGGELASGSIFTKKKQRSTAGARAASDGSDPGGGNDAGEAPPVPAFVDPRRSLARRKARELSDPPTDAFSSSGGSDDDKDEDEPSERTNRKSKSGTAREGDEFDRIEREMRKRKREYREELRPGYSNPRKN
ncbi:hypothetical protein JCM11491_001304 [Sporobolomyces phaffii]